MFVLALPLQESSPALTLLVFIGGLSAATGMVIVETIALSTMVCNDLVMPLLLRLKPLRFGHRADISAMLLAIRRAAIVLLMMLGYAYFRLAGEAYALVSIGLISFAAVAQFAPAMLGAIYWKNGTRRGAGRPGRGVPDLAVHAPAAVVRAVRLAAGQLCRIRAVRHRVAEAAATVWPGRAGPGLACAVLEHAGECRQLCRRVAHQSAKRGGTGAGHPVRGCLRPQRQRARFPCVARQCLGRSGTRVVAAFPWRRQGRRSVRAIPPRARRRQPAGGRRRAGAFRGNPAGRCDRCRIGARNDCLGGE
ncbi:hypothetical protein ACU4GD_11185 [Cupriavidus basilensis]